MSFHPYVNTDIIDKCPYVNTDIRILCPFVNTDTVISCPSIPLLNQITNLYISCTSNPINKFLVDM